MSVASIAITGSTFVGLIGLHIHAEPAGSVTDPTASSRTYSLARSLKVSILFKSLLPGSAYSLTFSKEQDLTSLISILDSVQN